MTAVEFEDKHKSEGLTLQLRAGNCMWLITRATNRVEVTTDKLNQIRSIYNSYGKREIGVIPVSDTPGTQETLQDRHLVALYSCLHLSN